MFIAFRKDNSGAELYVSRARDRIVGGESNLITSVVTRIQYRYIRHSTNFQSTNLDSIECAW